MGNGTSIGRVRGLGSAHEGAHHWLLQRFTAIGNLVLMLFLAVSLALLPDYSYGTVAGWASQTVPATALALLIVSAFVQSLPETVGASGADAAETAEARAHIGAAAARATGG